MNIVCTYITYYDRYIKGNESIHMVHCHVIR